jgi:hypothetical protein
MSCETSSCSVLVDGEIGRDIKLSRTPVLQDGLGHQIISVCAYPSSYVSAIIFVLEFHVHIVQDAGFQVQSPQGLNRLMGHTTSHLHDHLSSKVVKGLSAGEVLVKNCLESLFYFGKHNNKSNCIDFMIL